MKKEDKIKQVISRRIIIKDLKGKNTFLDVESYFIHTGIFDLSSFLHPKDYGSICLTSGDYDLHLDPFRTIILKEE